MNEHENEKYSKMSEEEKKKKLVEWLNKKREQKEKMEIKLKKVMEEKEKIVDKDSLKIISFNLLIFKANV